MQRWEIRRKWSQLWIRILENLINASLYLSRRFTWTLSWTVTSDWSISVQIHTNLYRFNPCPRNKHVTCKDGSSPYFLMFYICYILYPSHPWFDQHNHIKWSTNYEAPHYEVSSLCYKTTIFTFHRTFIAQVKYVEHITIWIPTLITNKIHKYNNTVVMTIYNNFQLK